MEHHPRAAGFVAHTCTCACTCGYVAMWNRRDVSACVLERFVWNAMLCIYKLPSKGFKDHLNSPLQRLQSSSQHSQHVLWLMPIEGQVYVHCTGCAGCPRPAGSVCPHSPAPVSPLYACVLLNVWLHPADNGRYHSPTMHPVSSLYHVSSLYW